MKSLRDAFASVVRSLETELAELLLLVRLSATAPSWGHAYRDAPAWTPDEPEPEPVRDAAIRLARAFGRVTAAELLERARLEVGRAADDAPAIRRWVIKLEAEDLVRVERDPKLSAELESMLRFAAASPAVQLGSVIFGVR